MGLDITSKDAYSRTSFNFTYVFDFSGFVSLCNGLIDGTISGTNYAINNLFTSYSDYVVKAQVYPFTLENFFDLGNTTSMFFGKTVISYNGYYPYIYGSGQGAPIRKWFEFSLSRTYNNFLDFEPYTVVKLYVPFFDLIELPLEKCYNETMEVYLSIDKDTGKSTLWIVGKTSTVTFLTKTTKLSVDLPLGKTNAEEKERNNILQSLSFVGSMVGLGVGVYSGNPLITAGSVGMLTKHLTTALNNNVDRLVSYTGGAESFDKWLCDKNIYLLTYAPQNVSVPDVALKGGVCKKNLSLSTVTGYTEIGEIHFNPNGQDIYDDEVSEIEQLLRDGVIL